MIIVLFLIGLSFGSFLLVVVDRLQSGESFVKGRSHCDKCGHVLAWYDLLPVVSFLLTAGSCRYCGKKLSFLYPISEVTCGLLFVLAWLTFPQTGSLMFWLPLISLLLVMMSLFVIFFSDLQYGTIPLPAVIIGLLSSCFFLLINQPWSFPGHLLSGIGAFLFFLALYLLTRGKGIGFGDVIFGLFMGFFLGFPAIIIGLYVAFLTGAFVSLILVLAGKKKLTGSTISFGPFLVLGTIIAFSYGDLLFRLLQSALHF